MPTNMEHAGFSVTIQVVLSNNVVTKIPIDKFKITTPKPQCSPNNNLMKATIVIQLRLKRGEVIERWGFSKYLKKLNLSSINMPANSEYPSASGDTKTPLL